MRLSAKERSLKQEYVGIFRVMDPKTFKRVRDEARRNVETARKIVGKHEREIKVFRSALRREMIRQEAIRQFELEQAESKA